MVGGTVNQNPGIMSLTAIIKATAANSLSPPNGERVGVGGVEFEPSWPPHPALLL